MDNRAESTAVVKAHLNFTEDELVDALQIIAELDHENYLDVDTSFAALILKAQAQIHPLPVGALMHLALNEDDE